MKTSVEWCDENLNISTGCDPMGRDCLHCYAAALASRGMTEAHEGTTRTIRRRNASGKLVSLPVYNGTVNLHPEKMIGPLKKRKPTVYFVNSMSDFFHEEIPHSYRSAMFGITNMCPRHTFRIPTKRDPRPFFEWAEREANRHGMAIDYFHWWQAHRMFPDLPMSELPPFERNVRDLQNIHLAVSVGYAKALSRIGPLLEVKAGLLWISAEPLLEEIDLTPYLATGLIGMVVIGGEAGTAAEPCNVRWIRSIMEQCDEYGVLKFVKQLGTRSVISSLAETKGWPKGTYFSTVGDVTRVMLKDYKGKDMSEWPEDLRIRELPEGAWS